ncbi:hypothetical protein ACG2QI_00165 [Bacillus sp. GM2]|uniref:hypothetical protein n=1 Tax=Bacillus TaxID=1386 RepID=UPI0006545EF3|nr:MULTISPECIES: hypothetical protein [Bacillus subtilis group]KRT92195.1 hypothetical protein ACH97_211800 [Bacillus paralicheniformis]MBU8759277.1 hypothetical protein [Bacillus paralicheniformis]MBZ5213395.1 hypothetical protein [Bacillus paralicheniformis]MEC1867905.1 hypothetical protein [Bacillus paralicheniformis]OMI09323.1 hypothetical protein BVL54_17650 [Bacillus paralicheniformis]
MSGSLESSYFSGRIKVSSILADTEDELSVEDGVTPEQTDVIERLTQLRDNSFKLRQVIGTWKENELNERNMRKRIATFILLALGIEMVLGNVILILMGFLPNFRPPEWTCNLFFTGMYTQIVAVATIVVRNLFPPVAKDPSSAISELIKNL